MSLTDTKDTSWGRRERWQRIFGIYLFVLGGTHFLAPGPWDVMTRLVRADNVRRWTYGFGAFESAMGVLVLNRRTRWVGYLSLLAQGGLLMSLRAAVVHAKESRHP